MMKINPANKFAMEKKEIMEETAILFFTLSNIIIHDKAINKKAKKILLGSPKET